jgi:hypothetical protein
LLEVFRDLEVHGADTSKLSAFVNDLTKVLPLGWTRDRERERALNRYSRSEPQFAFGIASEEGRPAAVLFLMRRDKALKITNIVPDVGELTRHQYNTLVEAFDAICEPIAEQHGLRVHVGPDQQDISDMLTSKTMKALQLFSDAANKGTGSSHPLDRKRWLKFLVLAHNEDTALDTETLTRWLVEEQRWSEDQAGKLSVQYEFARDLLEEHDKSGTR